MVLEKYHASRAACHGGDYNGVSCRRIIGNCIEITKEVKTILEAKKNESCDKESINEKIYQLEQTLGLLDAAFFFLNIPHPTDEEKQKASDAAKALSQH